MKENIGTQGQTIVEAIVVLGVVVLLVTGLIAGTTSSLRSVQAGRTRSVALKFAEQGMEFIRNLRNQQWSTFQSNSGLYCLDSSMTLTELAFPPCTINITTPEGAFARSINFTWDNIDEKMTVVATVSYIEGSQSKNVTLTSYFTNWK